MKLDFAFYVGGLEQSIINLLKNGDADLQQAGMVGVKEFATYSGELNREDVIDALKSMAPRFPLVLVSYGSGKDKRKAPTGLIDKEPIEVEHTCGFVVIVASNDLRGREQRKTSAFQTIGEARQLLGGVQFEITVEGAGGAPDEDVLLNHSPLVPAAVETIVRLPDLTAYAVHFETMFHEWLPDRRVAVGNIEEILLGIEPSVNNDDSGNPSGQNQTPPQAFDGFSLPGVEMEKKL